MSDHSNWSPEPEDLGAPLGEEWYLPSERPTNASPSSLQPRPSSQASQSTLCDDGTPKLKDSTSGLFTKGAFSRRITATKPHKVLYTCLAPGCRFNVSHPPDYSTTSNLFKHLDRHHPATAHIIRGTAPTSKRSASTSLPSPANFFVPRQDPKRPRLQADKFRELLLQFIVANNLPLSLVESPSLRELIYNISPAAQLPSARTLRRDLEQQFVHHRDILKHELQAHIHNGGRLSITTDGWGASNSDDYEAYTVSFIDEKWKRRATMLDIVHLKEPIHSGEYLAEKMLNVTNDFGITGGIFTVTRDNATNMTAMLRHFETAAGVADFTVDQPWSFTSQEGDVRCMAHIINLAAQIVLTTLKAVPAEDWTTYRCEEDAARLPTEAARCSAVTSCVEKLRRHIYVFRDRRLWRIGLQRQATAVGVTYRRLKLDMPVRWNSTFSMLNSALALQVPITAHCASQTLDLSMRDIALTAQGWTVLHTLREMFEIFVKPTKMLQGDAYPTLNHALLLYLKMMNKLDGLREKLGVNSTIGLACTAAYDKLNHYYTLAVGDLKHSHSTIATICDPRLNLRAFNQLWAKNDQTEQRNRARVQFHAAYNRYKHRADEIEVSLPSSNTTQEEVMAAVDSDDDLYITSQRSTEAEWKRWIQEPGIGRHTDIMQYWTAKQHEYPIIAQIARDQLAIPATSAASERVFSAGGGIITKKRNRLSPSTVRYLLCLRAWGVLPPPETTSEEGTEEVEDDENED